MVSYLPPPPPSTFTLVHTSNLNPHIFRPLRRHFKNLCFVKVLQLLWVIFPSQVVFLCWAHTPLCRFWIHSHLQMVKYWSPRLPCLYPYTPSILYSWRHWTYICADPYSRQRLHKGPVVGFEIFLTKKIVLYFFRYANPIPVDHVIIRGHMVKFSAYFWPGQQRGYNYQ